MSKILRLKTDMDNMQRTLVLIKPDGVKRNLIGEIVNRFERAGLVLHELRLMTAEEEVLQKHYPEEEEYLISIGKKSEAAGDKIDNHLEHGRKIVLGLREYLKSGPIVAMVLEGPDAITLVRKITGYTDPASADQGTIRGDLGEDSIKAANSEGRPVQNLIHASGNPEEAAKEIQLWFGD
jgi:nucleoside-diphosphate kinase